MGTNNPARPRPRPVGPLGSRLGLRSAMLSAVGTMILACPARAGDDWPLDLSRRWAFETEMAEIALWEGKLADAEAAYRRAAGIVRPEAARDPRLLAKTYTDLAWTLHLEDRDADAEPIARWALDVRSKRFGPVSREAGRSASVLASIQQKLGRLDEAEASLEIVLGASKRSLGESSLATADALVDLATVHSLRRRYDRARPLWNQALGLYRAQGPGAPGYLLGLDGLAAVEIAQGDWNAAETLLREALTAFPEETPATSTARASALAHLALVYRATGRAGEADRLEAKPETQTPGRATPPASSGDQAP